MSVRCATGTGDDGEVESDGLRPVGISSMNELAPAPKRIKLPPEVARIYEAVNDLEKKYPGRKFTPDGHMVGSIGEVVAAEALGLTLLNASHPAHDAQDETGYVQIKMTAGSSVAMYATCERLVVLRIVSPHEAEIVYDGPGQPAWDVAGRMAKNGQRVISLARLRGIAARVAALGRRWELQARDGHFEDIPASFKWDDSAAFAHLLNAYEIMGTEAVGELANGKLNAAEAGNGWAGTATDLWMCLFFEHRRWRHAGIEPGNTALHTLDGLCQTLRQRLLALSLVERQTLLALLVAYPFPGTVEALRDG